MKTLPRNSSDQVLLAYIDRWAALLEREDYAAAFDFTDHDADMAWTPDLVQKVIKSYGNATVTQHVTVEGKPTDITQRKEVTRWPKNRLKGIGEIWYDLNIDGFASDLTATFWIVDTGEGLRLVMNDIHVM